MGSFTISIADIPIRIFPFNREIIRFFSDYLCDLDPLITINISKKDIEFERYKSDLQNEKKNKEIRRSDLYLENLAILRKIADIIPEYGTFLFHGSAVVLKDKTYLFTAPSGTGKTTHIRKWLKMLPGSYILNGDKPFIRLKNEQILVCGTPWRGKEGYGCNDMKPLGSVCIIEQDKENHICPLAAEEAFPILLNQTHLPEGKLLTMIELIKTMISGTDIYKLSCNMEDEAAQLSIEAMVKDETGRTPR